MKIIYLNKKTGEEVHYGETLTFQAKGTHKDGYQYEYTFSLPVVNETIPLLIEHGFLVQKEVCKSKEQEGTSQSSTPQDLDIDNEH